MRSPLYRLSLIVSLAAIASACGSSVVLRPTAEETCQSSSANPGNVGNKINTTTDDYAPKLIGSTLIYSTGVHVAGKFPKALRSELVMAEHTAPLVEGQSIAGGWSPPQLLGTSPYPGIRLDLNEGAIDILPKLHYAVFAAERVVQDSEQSSLMDLYEATVDDHFHAAAPPVPITAVNDPNSWDSQPALNQSADTLYFVSDRPRELGQKRGNMHIWRSAKVAGAWSKPIPVEQLWTSGNDVTPSIGSDGYLYFSSDGNPDHKSAPSDFGGRDIFRVRLNGGVPSGDIERLPAPINSSANDDFPSVSADGTWLLLASDRGGGCGGRDIYAFTRPVRLHLRGVITQSIECDSGRVKVTPFRTSVMLSGPNGFAKTISSDDSGRYFADLGDPGNYTVRLEGLRCSDKNISADISAPRPMGIEATYEKNINVPRVTLRDTLGRGSKIPFFITGYWRPNTSHNLEEFRQRRLNDPAFAGIHYIRDNDWNYETASRQVDSILAVQVYRPILDSLLPLLQNQCFDSTYGIHIQVNGYTDSNHILVHDPYRDVDVFPDDQPPIRNGEPLLTSEADNAQGEWGNKRLSAVRAYFTEQEVLRDLIDRSPLFKEYYDRGKVWAHYTGRGIDRSIRGNLGFNRRVDIVAWIGNQTGSCN